MLRYQPLLRQQRDLYDVPRGPQRFRAYLSLMLNEAQNEMELPLAAFNPMGRETVASQLDQWIALGADEVAANAVMQVGVERELDGDFRLALVLCDDSGGWTNRATSEFSRRFETGTLLRRHWIEGALWTSQEPSAQLAREAILVALHRAVYIAHHGIARTLHEMLKQELFAASQAKKQSPNQEEKQLNLARRVVGQHANSLEWPVQMACLFGDEAAIELGLIPLGMPGNGALTLLV